MDSFTLFFMEPKGHIGDEIRKYLNVQKRNVTWLADEINHDQSNLNKHLQKPHIHSVLLFKISQALGVDFFTYYSQQLPETTEKVNFT